MSDAIVGAVVFFGLIIIGFCLGGFVYGTDNNQKLDTCAKQNNVYECEIIAVPKTKDRSK
jgi:hypothetical protein